VSHIISWCVNCPWKNGEPTKRLCTSSDCSTMKHCNPIGYGKVETAHPLFKEFGIDLCRKCAEKLMMRIRKEYAD
jgi:hypothetical protein